MSDPKALPQGTYDCPHCGADWPHRHDQLAELKDLREKMESLWPHNWDQIENGNRWELFRQHTMNVSDGAPVPFDEKLWENWALVKEREDWMEQLFRSKLRREAENTRQA